MKVNPTAAMKAFGSALQRKPSAQRCKLTSRGSATRSATASATRTAPMARVLLCGPFPKGASSDRLSGPNFRSVDQADQVGENCLTGRDVARIVEARFEAAGFDRDGADADLVTRQGIRLETSRRFSGRNFRSHCDAACEFHRKLVRTGSKLNRGLQG
jgi:hypothetical protein